MVGHFHSSISRVAGLINGQRLLAAELRAARIKMSCAVLDAIADDPDLTVDESIEQLKRVRANRFAEVARLFDDLKTLQPPTLPAIQVTIRALSRLAA